MLVFVVYRCIRTAVDDRSSGPQATVIIWIGAQQWLPVTAADQQIV